MISTIPTYSCTLRPAYKAPHSLWFASYRGLDLLPCVHALFAKATQSTRTLYGTRIYQDPTNA